MALNSEDKPFIRDVIADFLTKKKLQTKELCEEKMGNMEDNVKNVNNKLWAIILLHLTLLGTVAFIGFR